MLYAQQHHIHGSDQPPLQTSTRPQPRLRAATELSARRAIRKQPKLGESNNNEPGKKFYIRQETEKK